MVPSAGLACLPINNGVITRNGNKKKKNYTWIIQEKKEGKTHLHLGKRTV